MACCECHDHKYDPFKTRDFYSAEAFFADMQEKPVGRQEETPMPTAEQSAKQKQLDEQIAAVRKTLDTQTPDLEQGQAEWEEQAKRDLIPAMVPQLVSAILAPVKPPILRVGKL